MSKPPKSKFRSFNEAREYVRSLNFKGLKEYAEWTKTSDRPQDIPIAPSKTYKSEWLGWGDWLGTFNIASSKRVFKPFNEAREYVRNLNLNTGDEYFAWTKTSARPLDIPAAPSQTYKSEWLGWGDWLGTFTIASSKRVFRPFNEAKEYVRNLNLNNGDEYIAWTKTSARPLDIPIDPSKSYKAEWINWGDWLGTLTIASSNRVFRPFNEAREYVRSLNLNNGDEYVAWTKTLDIPQNIPKDPAKTYKADWIGMGDWLGTFTIAHKNKTFRPFKEAREHVRSLNFKGQSDYFAWSKSTSRPQDIPTSPSQTYKGEWLGWGDWLGTFTITTHKRTFRTFAEAREHIRSLNFESRSEYAAWAKTVDRP